MRKMLYTREINNNLLRLDFDRRFTQRAFDTGDALSGNALASFLLGAMSGGGVDNNFYPTFRWNYYAPWIQDDWKIGNRLTLNLGLRWDFNTPVFEERGSHQLDVRHVHGEPAADVARAGADAWLRGRGGPTFVSVNGEDKYPYKRDNNMIQPRFGFAYMLDDKTIMRGGYGIYYLNVVGISASDGFSVQTPPVTSLDGDRTSTNALTNPFPSGILNAPGSSNGPVDEPRTESGLLEQRVRESLRAPVLGTASSACSPGASRSKPPTSARARRSCRTAGRASTSRRWSCAIRCDPSKGGNPGICNELLPNPFFQIPGFEGTSRFTSPTLSRYELSRPFPQFGQITEFDRNDGNNWYNSAQFVLNKRASDGLEMLSGI